MNEITEQEMAAAREIYDKLFRSCDGLAEEDVATIIHKHNEGLWNQWVVKWQATVDTLVNANARALEAEQQCDQLAARCAELEKALTKLASMVWESRWVSEEQDYQDSVAFAAELRSDLISSPSSSLTRLQELERKAKALDEVFAKCQVVFFPLDGHYIEHNLAAHKDNREAIESAIRKEK